MRISEYASIEELCALNKFGYSIEVNDGKIVNVIAEA